MSRPLRFVTINTWKNEGDYTSRLGALAVGLGELTPDVVLLQEVFRTLDGEADTGRVLAAELGLELAYAPAREKPREWRGRNVPSESGLAVLVRGRLGVVERVALPSDERGGERIALLVAATLPGNTNVRVACAHLSHLRDDSVRRREQLEAILAHPMWREPAALRVLGGDFNASIDTPELRSLADHGQLQIADVFGGMPENRITHPMPARKGGIGRCIDFLLTVTPQGQHRPVVKRAGVALNAPIGGVWPSDHAAVFAEIL